VKDIWEFEGDESRGMYGKAVGERHIQENGREETGGPSLHPFCCYGDIWTDTTFTVTSTERAQFWAPIANSNIYVVNQKLVEEIGQPIHYPPKINLIQLKMKSAGLIRMAVGWPKTRDGRIERMT
jgi:hypothetical protein